MTIRFGKGILMLAACAAAAAIPATSQAAGTNAMDNCIRTFVAEQLPKGRKIEVVKREMTPLYWGSTRPLTIQVQAKGKRSGKEIAAATCEMNGKGELVAMHVKGERIRYANASQPKSDTHGG